MSAGRRERATLRRLLNTYRIFNIELPERAYASENIQDEYKRRIKQFGYLPEFRNNPQPQHARAIKINPRFLNEPICFMDTEDTKSAQDSWWPSSMPVVQRPKPPYDKQSTQRSDFGKPACRLSPPVKYSSKLQPSRGIVPLASPQPPTSLPTIFKERLSFKHHYDARATPCVPYQGKKHGTFVRTEIKPAKGTTAVPGGTEPVPGAGGPGSLEEPRTEKGKSEESMTSARLRLPDSQEAPPDSDTHLSKTDIRTGAKADPRAPEKGQESSEISQASKAESSHGVGEMASSPAKNGSPDKPQEERLPPIHKAA